MSTTTQTVVAPDDRLALTCTRLGTCCHGHQIFICPWELAELARGKGLTPRAFRDRYTDCGGTRLIFAGAPGPHGPPSHFGKPACNLYDSSRGCTVHPHRPLACRLYPLGRQRHQGAVRYYNPGERLPCFSLCPGVENLPRLTVAEYLVGQGVGPGEAAHDRYAALSYGMVNAAKTIAGLVASIDRAALLARFQALIAMTPQARAGQLAPLWFDRLTIPELSAPLDDAGAFADAHGQALGTAIQTDFGGSSAPDALAQAVDTYLVMALHLGSTVGADAQVMATLLAG